MELKERNRYWERTKTSYGWEYSGKENPGYRPTLFDRLWRRLFFKSWHRFHSKHKDVLFKAEFRHAIGPMPELKEIILFKRE